MCKCNQIEMKRSLHGSSYKFRCTKNGQSKVFTIASSNDSQAEQLCELECKEWEPKTSNGGGGGCFAAGTKVLMADGCQKDIESLKAGDRVLGGSQKFNETLAANVLNVFQQSQSAVNVAELNGGETLTMSRKQALATPYGPVQSSHIVLGSRLASVDAQNSWSVDNSKIKSIHAEVQDALLYSLELEDADYYFVGEAKIAAICDGNPTQVKL